MMKNRLAFLIAIAIALAGNFLLVETSAAKTKAKPKAPPAEPLTYTHKDRHFSFTLPADWAKQSDDVNSDSVLFMAQPLSKTCSFQINMTRMQLDFPAASLDSATKDI